MSRVEETVGSALEGLRLDRAVALVCDVSRSTASRLLDEGRVRIDGARAATGARRVAAGELLTVDIGPATDPLPEADPSVVIETVFEDPDVVVVNKPADLVVHPGAGNDCGTLVHGLLARYPDIAGVGEPDRPGIVHRLDKGTSGLLVVARTARAHRSLSAQLRSHLPERVYSALVWGHPEATTGVIDAPVGRSSRNPLRMAVTPRGRAARTLYRVERRYNDPSSVALLTCTLETGRTHQIRVHLRAIGHSVVGDRSYGSNRDGSATEIGLDPGRPFLHAGILSFSHPVTGDPIRAEAPLPDDLAAVLARCH